MGAIRGNGADQSDAFRWTMGESGAPPIGDAKASIEREADENREPEHFDHFILIPD